MPVETSVVTVIDGRRRDLMGLQVERVLPSMQRRAVGPYVFLDVMGPTDPEGVGVEVAPHPHIGLATVTYLFEGEILHRDSLGTQQRIRPGAVNWMSAGRGIVHSERTAELAAGPRRAVLHGTQFWVALPLAHEESEPSFQHHPAESLPELDETGLRLRVLAGSAYGVRAPVQVLSNLFQVHAELDAGAALQLPDEHEERAVYVVHGAVECEGTSAGPGRLLAMRPGSKPMIRASAASRVMLLGGDRLDAPRHMDWNFVSSSKERLEHAKQEWRAQRFPKVPGDEQEWIALP